MAAAWGCVIWGLHQTLCCPAWLDTVPLGQRPTLSSDAGMASSVAHHAPSPTGSLGTISHASNGVSEGVGGDLRDLVQFSFIPELIVCKWVGTSQRSSIFSDSSGSGGLGPVPHAYRPKPAHYRPGQFHLPTLEASPVLTSRTPLSALLFAQMASKGLPDQLGPSPAHCQH